MSKAGGRGVVKDGDEGVAERIGREKDSLICPFIFYLTSPPNIWLLVPPCLLAVHYLVPWHGWHPVRVSFQCPHFLAMFHIPKRRSSIWHSNCQKSATNVWGRPFDGAHVVNFARQGQKGTNFTRVGIPDQSKIRTSSVLPELLHHFLAPSS